MSRQGEGLVGSSRYPKAALVQGCLALSRSSILKQTPSAVIFLKEEMAKYPTVNSGSPVL